MPNLGYTVCMTNKRRKIYVTEPDMIDMDLARELLPVGEFTLVEGSTDFTQNRTPDCEALLIRSGTLIKSDILEYFPQLKHVIRVGVGLDNVDTVFLTSHNIKIHNAPGANGDAVAEYVVAMLLSVLRRTTSLLLEDALHWNRMKFMGRSISSQVVGIVGFGHIGRLLHQKLKGLGCTQFYVYDPYVSADEVLDGTISKVGLNELIAGSTVISLHLPLLPETKYIIDAEKLHMMQDDTILINAARGGIVSEADLLRVIQEKPLHYVADVVEDEPRVNEALLEHKNITITPHIGSLTTEANADMLKVALRNFLQSLDK